MRNPTQTIPSAGVTGPSAATALSPFVPERPRRPALFPLEKIPR
jgi:hypothetical protein